jgi:ABC-type multidrug transport system fused ATPase/permease subunit
MSGIRVVKAFAQENREFDQFQRNSTYMRDSRLWVENATSVYSAAMQLVFSLGGLIVWYVGGRDVIGREMTLGSLIAFLAYLAMFYAPLATLSNFTTWLTRSAGKRSHDDCHRASPLDTSQRRPNCGVRSRAADRAGQSRGTAVNGRRLFTTCEDSDTDLKRSQRRQIGRAIKSGRLCAGGDW